MNDETKSVNSIIGDRILSDNEAFEILSKQVKHVKEEIAKTNKEELESLGINGCRMHFGPVGSKEGWFFSVPKEPTTHEEYVALLEELVRMSKAPDVEDNELL